MCEKVLPLLAAVLLVSCSRQSLPREGWSKENRLVLDELMAEASGGGAASYAVLDFDGTIVKGCPEIVAMAWQIENLRFRMTPDVLWNVVLGCVPDIDAPLSGLTGVSARMLATDIMNDYVWLYDNHVRDGRVDLDAIHESAQYLDFRAKMWALSSGVDGTFGYEAGCLWPLRLYYGMSVEEVREMVRVATDEALETKRKAEEWSSPEMGESGLVTVEVERGLEVTKGMLNLCETLIRNGIDVYICSASYEEAVEAVACDSAYGLGLSAGNVYGVRLSSSGKIGLASYDAGYPQPFLGGKVDVIRRFIAPKYGNASPVLVAGDSGGDHAMLTAFPDLKVGLLVDPSPELTLDLYSGQKAVRDAARHGLPSGGTLYLVQE